jgi:hypothetical protein
MIFSIFFIEQIFSVTLKYLLMQEYISTQFHQVRLEEVQLKMQHGRMQKIM